MNEGRRVRGSRVEPSNLEQSPKWLLVVDERNTTHANKNTRLCVPFVLARYSFAYFATVNPIHKLPHQFRLDFVSTAATYFAYRSVDTGIAIKLGLRYKRNTSFIHGALEICRCLAELVSVGTFSTSASAYSRADTVQATQAW